MTKQIIVIYR